MAKQIYVIGDEGRLVVRNFIQKFKEAAVDWMVTVIAPDEDNIIFDESDKNAHVVVCLWEEMNFEIVTQIASAQKKFKFYIYFIGANFSFGIEEDKYFNKIPSVRFTSYSFEMDSLLAHIEENNIEKKRILVVDDEPIVLRSIKNWLGDGFEVSLVNSGEMALEFLLMHPVDLVLLDYKMPTMEGPEVLRKIRGEDNLKRLAVIFLTAKNDKESVVTVAPLKPQGYILKTMSPEEIKKSVVDFFRNRIITV